MTAVTFTCPQCLQATPVESDARFCPRCGLAISDTADTAQQVWSGGYTVIVRNLLAHGDVCNLYHCDIQNQRRAGLFKIARTPAANVHVANEARMLTELHAGPPGRHGAFLPRVLTTLNYASPDAPAQQANVLGFHEEIRSPRELYTLEEVRSVYAEGVDPRDVSWMWRRVLTVLGFVHGRRIAHTTITPDHVLIEPEGHKLLLIGWCGAVRFGQVPHLTPARWRDWGSWNSAASPATDLATAARTMQYLLGSNPEPAIARHLERCQGLASDSSSQALKILDDFDRLIEALWGPRQFRPFNMPVRRV